ncbi:MAG: hypothetical protein P8M72_07370 [Gammaproteobacteria bacterium]|nr:hypothetical protein [Gammaproteobacteria bacterium]
MFLVLFFISQLTVAQPPGCTDNPHFDDFDFWIGQWEVSDNTNGNLAGSNSITKELNNCLVMENWNGASGSTGKSINYFNLLTDVWRQVWVAPGYSIDISGSLMDVSMELVGTISYHNDAAYDFRGTWTPNDDGSVRQFFEQYDSEAESWVVWFDGLYVKRE